MTRVRIVESKFCLLALLGVLSLSGGEAQKGGSHPTLDVGGPDSRSKNAGEENRDQQALSVEQFTKAIQAAKSRSDKGAAQIIEPLELAERLNSQELSRLTEGMPGAESRAALTAVVDASVFLEPPQRDVPDIAAPDLVEQQQILARALSYLDQMIPRLPDFYATRTAQVFEKSIVQRKQEALSAGSVLRSKGTFQATVLYQNGKEIVQSHGPGQVGLTTRGTFGPVLSGAITNDLRRPMQWSHWESGPSGTMAVFRFRVSRKNSHFGVSFPMGGLAVARPTGYLGEIGVAPKTGTILRVVLRSDPVPGFGGAVEHANIMLEYGSVLIGGKDYTCAVRGVSLSTSTYREKGLAKRNKELVLLNDVVFSDYHVFRSEMRVLPGGD